MNRFVATLIIILCTTLSACSNNEATQLTLDASQLTKAVNHSNVIAYVTIDSGPATRVTFEDASAKTIVIDAINPDQRHDYTVAWHEWIDGVELVLSRQNGELTVTTDNPTANLNSEHITAFDSDGDGAENLTERKNGTCPRNNHCGGANGFYVANHQNQSNLYPLRRFIALQYLRALPWIFARSRSIDRRSVV